MESSLHPFDGHIKIISLKKQSFATIGHSVNQAILKARCWKVTKKNNKKIVIWRILGGGILKKKVEKSGIS